MCDHNVITGCLIEGNTYGVELSGFADVVEQNEVIGNVIKNNSYGIYDHGTVANTYTDNMIYGGDTGIHLTGGSDHHIFHNDLFWNTENAYDDNRSYWDDGYPSGGNYWDDYTGGDLDGDGIGDTPHPIPGNGETDDYPLMYPRSLICGDADMSGQIDIDDIVRMISIVFPEGVFDPPEFECLFDVNGSGQYDIDDVVYLISYIFGPGPPPPEDCCAPPW
jgi:nitrous oxidase accessory protein NosD